MKIYSLALSMLLLATLGYAQPKERRAPIKDKFTLKWGKEHKDKSTANKFIGTIDDNTYVLKSLPKLGGTKYYIDKLNEKLDVVKTAEIEMKFEKNELIIDDAIMFGGRIFLVGSYMNKKTEMNYLFYQPLDLDDLTLTDELEKIASYSFEEGSRRDRGAFDYEISKDATKLFVYYNTPVNKASREQFGFHIYDAEMGLLWEKEVTIPYSEGLFDIIEYELDNNGDVYVLGKLYKEKAKDKRKGKVNYEMRLLAFNEKEDDPEEYEIGIKDVFLKDMSLLFKEDQIVCVGFYSKNAGNTANGCFALAVDKATKEILVSNLEEFSLDFITLNMTDKQEKKARKKDAKGDEVETSDMYIRNIIVRENGSIVVVAEEYYLQVVTSYTPGVNGAAASQRTTYHYHYNDIIVFSISSDYEIEWYNKGPKYQHTINDGGFYSSFFLLPTSDRLVFIFNDNIKNLHVVKAGKGAQFTGSKKTSIAVAFSMDYEGNTGKAKLFNVKTEEILVRPKVCAKGGQNEILIFAQRKKDQRYGRVTVN